MVVDPDGFPGIRHEYDGLARDASDRRNGRARPSPTPEHHHVAGREGSVSHQHVNLGPRLVGMRGVVHDSGTVISAGGKVEYVPWVVSQVSQKCLERSIFCDRLRRILHGRVVIISVRTAAARTDTIAIAVLIKA